MVDSKENYKFEVGVEGLTNELLCCYCLTKHSYVYFQKRCKHKIMLDDFFVDLYLELFENKPSCFY